MILELNNVVKNYELGKTIVKALKGVSLKIDKGEFVSIAGPSGSGKSTLLNLIGCIDRPTSGGICIDGKDIEGFNENQRADLRLETIGFIFQSFNLISVLNIYENVEFPLLLKKGLSKKQRKERVMHFVDAVELSKFVKHKPMELSGGQRQRVAIARALVTTPKMILADEPTANLDSKTGETIIDLMKDINKKEKTTFIFSTHDPAIMSHAQRVIKLHDGEIVES